MPRPRRGLKSGNVPDVASLSETVDYGALDTGSPYSFNDVQLAQFARATMVARGYQFYKIRRVTFNVQPLLDTFASGGTTQMPYLYWIINRTGNGFPALNKQWFLDNGAKGIRFDDKTVKISYTPAIVVDAVEAGVPGVGNQANLPKLSPWLTTNRDSFASVWNPSQVSHCGHFMAIYSEGGLAMKYRVTLTIEISFKKPLATPPIPGVGDAALVIKNTDLLVPRVTSA